VAGWQCTHIDEIAAEQWPYWAPVRHHFGIQTFGVNAWRGGAGDEVIKRHTERDSGRPELYFVLSGDAAFTVGEDEVAAPAGTMVWVEEPSLERVAVARAPDTVVLSISGGPPSGWDTGYLES
jgi:mannose-6-phosphate isomerase-like protein (cupin superfamily)